MRNPCFTNYTPILRYPPINLVDHITTTTDDKTTQDAVNNLRCNLKTTDQNVLAIGL